MFVKIKDPSRHLTPDQVTRLSYEAGQTFGRRKFLIWREESLGGPHHALQIVRPVSEDDWYFDEEDRKYLGKVVWFQDGPEIVANPNEQFIRAYLMTRYYGEEYERGDMPFLYLFGRWLEQRIPQGEVWYGGDSGGCTMEPFDHNRREELLGHYMEVGHAPYDNALSPFREAPDYHCEFCGGVTMTDVGGSATYSFRECHGCGYSVIVRNGSGELLVELGPREEFHQASQRVPERAQAYYRHMRAQLERETVVL